jgi:anti-sigma factor RsiW
MKCSEVYLHICDNLDEEINSPRCRAIKQHLEECPDCRAYLASLKKTIVLYKSLPVPRVSRQAHRDLLTTIKQIGRPARTRRGKAEGRSR